LERGLIDDGSDNSYFFIVVKEDKKLVFEGVRRDIYFDEFISNINGELTTVIKLRFCDEEIKGVRHLDVNSVKTY